MRSERAELENMNLDSLNVMLKNNEVSVKITAKFQAARITETRP
jgi:hypothetical protein